MGYQVPEELADILADPETREPVRLANHEQLERLKRAILDGSAKRHDGGAIPEAFEAAFVAQAGTVAYLVVEGIPNFLIDHRVELSTPV